MFGPALAAAFALTGVMGPASAKASMVALIVLSILCIVQIGSWDSGVTLWRRAADVSGSDAAYVALGVQLAEGGSYVDAMNSYWQAVQRNRANPEAHGGLGVMLLRLGQTSRAVMELQASIQLEPRNLTAHVILAEALAKEGKPRAAITQVQAALALHPDTATKALLARKLKELEPTIQGQQRP